jgi:general secretion pathway protein B
MSFILDALRKSEIERQRQNGPGVVQFPIAREDRRLPIALVVIGFLLAVNLAVVLFFMLRDEAPPQPAASPAAAPAATTAAAQPVAAPAVNPLPAAPGPLASEVIPADSYESEPPAVYYEPPTQAPDAPDPTLLPRAGANPGVTPGVVMAGEDYAAVAAATGLPELTIDLHIYAAEPAGRAVFINGHRYTRGARLAEGPLVEDITPDGALLSYRGHRFLLPRL